MKKKFLYMMFLSVLAFGLSSVAKAERFLESIRIGDLHRTYIVYVPQGVTYKEHVPVIFVFHPALATGEFMETTTRLHEYGSEYIIVYPDGYRRTWNAGGKCCGKANDHNIDDVYFFKEILKNLKNKYSIQEKVYLTGFSNGSIFTYHLICNYPEMIAAAAPFGATRNMEGCKGNTSIPLLYIHGEVDSAAPVNGGYLKGKRMRERLGYMPSAKEIARKIANNNQCVDERQISEKWVEILGNTCETWAKGCNNNSSVSVCIVPNLGHTWPGAEQRSGWLAKKFGPARTDIDGSQAIIAFFREN